jgi:hypothetical protein
VDCIELNPMDFCQGVLKSAQVGLRLNYLGSNTFEALSYVVLSTE